MVGTKMMAALVKHCEASRAKLILLGDAKQLQGIEASGGFLSLAGGSGRTQG